MANDTRSGQKAKDDENNDTKGRRVSTRGSTSVGATTPDSSGLRRSTREFSSKKNTISSPLSTRKSVRLEKQTSMTPPALRKSERVEKRNMHSPLRRSERARRLSSSSSSGSKKSDRTSGSSDIKQNKQKKEKSVKQLTMETKEVNKSEKGDENPIEVEKKRLDARAYRALFKRQSKPVNESDHAEELNRMEKLSEGCSSNCRGSGCNQVDEGNGCSNRKGEDLREKCAEVACAGTLELSNSSGSETTKEVVENNVGAEEVIENNVEAELSHAIPSRQMRGCNKETNSSEGEIVLEVSKCGAMARSTSNDAEIALVDWFAQKNMQITQLVDSETSLERGDKVNLSKRKRNTVDMDSGVSAMPASKDICAMISDDITLSRFEPRSKNHPETCIRSFKRQRVNCDPTKREGCSNNTISNQDICDLSLNKDRGELEGGVTTGVGENCNKHVQQNGSSEATFQMEEDQNTCFICKLGGKLLCCEGKGCKSSYHLSCLDPPLHQVPLGAWYCEMCVQKKMESGVHSVSEGIESIWDDREVELSDDNGLQKQKQYFVKFKGLAHIHNCWLPESQVPEAASLVAKFNLKNQNERWKQEWTMPHRLLQKRSVVIHKLHDECHKVNATENLNCCHEWLVKWHGLDYEHATWELENASFLNSSEGQSLIGDYANRREKAKRVLRVDKLQTNERRKGSLLKLSQLTDGGSSGLDNYIDFVNKLREHWHKGQNVVVINDKERILKVVKFILSLLSDVCRPFLVISTVAALHSWDDKFLRLAPSVDTVVYNGSKDIRENIRMLEFYEERGLLMFQVLITSPEVLREDLHVFECIGWEAIIVDECQSTNVSSYFEDIKMLGTNLRILLVNNRLKDTSCEYLNMLSLLESHCNLNDGNHLAVTSSDNLKERLAKYIIYGCKSESSRFVEYWIPMQISNVQLEQYCATLLANSPSLCSSWKNDRVGALCNTLLSTRKCCDHPYVVDQSIQFFITKDLKEVEYLDVGIKASGKLQLLDAMLMEIKNQGLRVLVLFQSIGGAGRDLIGDILDDFLRQRFGPDSYERVERDLVSSKKQSAMNNFNKESGRFVFLLETRACHSSIKLSSIDTVIIFDSNWSPVNDLRALQKLTLDSQFEQIKIFRLYSTCTVEEKILILAKQNKVVDSNPQNINRTTTHMLLMWGASYLFDKLAEFHLCHSAVSNTSTLLDQLLLKDVIQEFLVLLTQNVDDIGMRKFSFILKARQNRGTYNTDLPLFGESKVKLLDEDLPHIFWTKLLEGKNPQWKYCSVSSQRNRKRVQYFHDSPEAENDGFVKKRKKAVNDNADPPSLKPRLEGGVVGERHNEGSQGSPVLAVSQPLPGSISCMNDAICGNHVSTLNHSTNDLLEIPEVMSDESGRQRQFCESQKNLHVLLKPEIAKLCGVLHLSEEVKDMVEKFLAYVMNNHQVRREPATMLEAFQISLCWIAASLLKRQIDHKESIALAKEHLKFGCKKEEADYVYYMLRCVKRMFLCHTGNLKFAYSPKASENSTEAVGKDQLDARLQGQESSAKHTLDESRLAMHFKLAQKDLSRSIKEIQKKCHKQMAKLLQKQKEEKEDFDKKYEAEKAQLENQKKMEAAIIRLHSKTQMKADRLKKLDSEYSKKFEELKNKMEIRLKNVEAMQAAAKTKVLEKESHFVEGVKSWAQVELFKPLCSPELQHCNKLLSSRPGLGMSASYTCKNVSDVVVECNGPIDTASTNCENAELETVASEEVSITGHRECNPAGFSNISEENVVSVDPPSGEENAVGAILDREVQPNGPEIITLNNGPADVFPVTCSSQRHMCNGATLSIPNGDILLDVSLNRPSSVENIPDPLRNEDDSSRTHEIVSLSQGPGNSVPMSSQLSEDQFPNRPTPYLPDGEASLSMHGTVSSNIGLENVFSVDPPSTGEQVPALDTLGIPSEEVQVEMPDTGPGEVRKVNTCAENDRQNIVASNNTIRADQPDPGSCACNQESHFQELSVMESPVMQTMSTSQQGHPMASNQVPQGACSLPTTSDGIQIGDGTAIQMQNVSQPVEPMLSQPIGSTASHQSNCEVSVPEAEVQMQLLPSRDASSGHNSPAAGGFGHQLRSGGQTAQLVECHIPVPNEAVLRPPASVPMHLLTDSSRLATHVADTRTAYTACSTSHSSHITIAVASRMPLPLYHDPLQNEIERICKETDVTHKIHEETKERLRSDCEKEVEQAIAQIRAKYDIKLQEVEAEFLLKKKELDTIHKKVFMSKILAEAFRSKCMDTKTSGAPGVQHDMTSSFRQQLPQLSSQHPAQRPSSVTGVPSGGPPVTNLHAAATPLGGLQAASSAGNRQATASLLQAVHFASTLASGTPMRPPVISPITPPMGNLQAGGEIRAPAPHLQRFRPSISVPSFPRGISSQSPTAISPSFQQHPARVSPFTYQSASYNRGALPAVSSSSLSAVDLLLDAPNPNLSSSLPVLSDSISNLDPLVQSQSSRPGSVQANIDQPGGAADIVYLSDDD